VPRLTFVFTQWIETKKKLSYKRNKLAQINKTQSHLRKKYTSGRNTPQEEIHLRKKDHNHSGSNSLVTNDRKPGGKATVEWEG